MPSGACVLAYDGKRGRTWRIKYADAEGRQVMETVGRESDGWTGQKAERALGAELDAVRRGHRKPNRRTFSDLIDEFEAVALPAKPRKKSPLVDYGCTIRLHLRPLSDTSTSRSCRGHRRSSSGTRETRSQRACHRKASVTISCSPG